MRHGLDYSAYNPTSVRAVDFVFVKITEGTKYTSTTYAQQLASAAANTQHHGGYHYARPEQGPARDQVARFLDHLQPKPGQSVWLDLESSNLSQAGTNAWAKDWGTEIRHQVPGITSGVYDGSGYVSSGTGKGLADYFDAWWYPQYPSKYQAAAVASLHDAVRSINRSHEIGGPPTKIAEATSLWPTSFTPWLPSGLTCGWTSPHIWQFTDNQQGIDGSILRPDLDLNFLSGKGGTTTLEDSWFLATSG